EMLPKCPNLEVELLAPVESLWRKFLFTHLKVPRIARDWGADLYFSVSENAPLWTPCPRIAAFRNPNIHTKLDQNWPRLTNLRLTMLRGISRLSAAMCQRVLFVSHDSSEWIGESLRVPRNKRCVIEHGIDPENWKTEEVRPLHTLPYVLSVSSIYRYKNFVRLIEAYALMADRNHDCPDLLIIGDDQDPEYSAKMAAARENSGEFAENIHILGEVSYSDIRDYYAAAEIFVFPSFLETFGHPLLEAMASGLPAVVADIPVFREVADNAVLYADPYSTAALAEAMEQVLFKPVLAETLSRRGRQRVTHFSMERTVARLLDLFDEVCAESQTNSEHSVVSTGPSPGELHDRTF
ncbi:MAG: glycosyltransferase family 4 protein, partial [Planctomycetes bacterium]|nr:glycosyltransferase family 4 protein [Planctomycetota bacterium]